MCFFLKPDLSKTELKFPMFQEKFLIVGTTGSEPAEIKPQPNVQSLKSVNIKLGENSIVDLLWNV